MRWALGFWVSAVIGLAGCQAESPPSGLEATCAKACEGKASQCSAHQCMRGCNLVIDRLAEHEADHVLGCVADAKNACDDRAWARCATRIGVHADGGPPAPQPPPSLLEQEGD
jgi:hypothetical protein